MYRVIFQLKVNITLQKQIEETFFQTLEDIKTKDNLRTFFKDFLSEEDFEKLVKKLAIAYWIKKGRDEENIKNNLDVKTSEINEVKKVMDTKGVKLAIKYMEAEEFANVWARRIKKIV